VNFLWPNTLFSPYVSFLSSFLCAYLADDPTTQMAIRLSLGMNPIDPFPQPEVLCSECRPLDPPFPLKGSELNFPFLLL
jgi:hypothetical protein